MIKKHSQHGAAILMFVLFFSFATGLMMLAFVSSMFSDLHDFSQLVRSKQAYLVADSAVEDVSYRMVMGTFSVDASETVTLRGVTATTNTVYDSPNDEYTITSTAQLGNVERSSEAILTIGAGSAFNYGLQAGNGGITLSNNSDIFGNIYSNGAVTGAGSAEVYGDIISAGPSGLIETITATGSVYANTIDTVDADGDAHYNTALGSNNIGGTIYSPATNPPLVDLPISTTTVQEWKDAIDTYGTTITAADSLCSSGTYTIDTSITIGYLKVECNVDIKKTGSGIVVTLDGPIWVEGNLSFTQGPEIRVASSLGRQSVQFLVDNPADRLTSSQIEIRNSTEFYGSGDDRSYIMLMSFNESASSSGSEVAIDLGQSANGDVLAYAGAGLVDIGQNIDLREVTGYQIEVSNGSSITYESGLANLLFTSGPGGAYVLSDWQQIE